MRCLITGATGFVGGHLINALVASGHEAIGLARRSAASTIPIHVADLCDLSATETILRTVRPDWLFHLAGYANPGKSFSDPAAAWSGNLSATQGLYQAIVRSGVWPRILYVSSGLVYGDAGHDGTPCTEVSPLRPDSPYAASKAAADLLSYQQTRSPGLDIVRVRPFNQIGPSHSAEYAAANFARQIVAIERGEKAPVVTTGDLSARRDLTDVRDMVRAYIRLLESGKTGDVFNAGSGQTYPIHEVLDRLVAMARVNVEVDQQMDGMRAGDTAIAWADTRKLRAATGWTPEYTLDQTLADILADWRQRSL